VAKDETIVSGMAGRYASALFELAQERGATEQVAADLARFNAMVDESADLKRLVRSPAFSAEEQIRALGAVLDKAGIGGPPRSS
jgi:F-type H+-transporting ATPase subunit delta